MVIRMENVVSEKEGIRVVGSPNGIEILYIEDYVYSFMRFLLSERRYTKIEAILLGAAQTEGQKHYYYIYGMVLDKEDLVYFPEINQLGTGIISCYEEEKLQIQIKTDKGKAVDFTSFYIYYKENIPMKNYILSYGKQEPMEKKERREIGEKHQNHSATLRQISNIFKYTIAVCILAYVIISLNNYSKLQTVKEQADYIMSTISQEDVFYTQ